MQKIGCIKIVNERKISKKPPWCLIIVFEFKANVTIIDQTRLGYCNEVCYHRVEYPGTLLTCHLYLEK